MTLNCTEYMVQLAYSTGTFMMSKNKLRPLAQREKVSHQTWTSRTKNMSNFSKNTTWSQSNTKYESESGKRHIRYRNNCNHSNGKR